MKNSLDFVKNRIKNGETRDMNISDYESIEQVDLLKWLDNTNNKKLLKHLTNGIVSINEYFSYSVKYNPNEEYDYFTMSSCICDGTLMFYNGLCENVLNKVLNAETCKNDIMTDEIYNNIKEYIIEYTIGDFVFGDEYDLKKFGTKEKPWMYSRFTVMLPIKFIVRRKER